MLFHHSMKSVAVDLCTHFLALAKEIKWGWRLSGSKAAALASASAASFPRMPACPEIQMADALLGGKEQAQGRCGRVRQCSKAKAAQPENWDYVRMVDRWDQHVRDKARRRLRTAGYVCTISR